MTNKKIKIHHSFFNKRQDSFTVTVYNITHIGEPNIKEEVYTITCFDEAVAISKNYKNTIYYDTKHFALNKKLPQRETSLLISRIFGV